MPGNHIRTNSEIMRPIAPMSTLPLNSNFAVNPFENTRSSSESGTNSATLGVCTVKN